MLPRYSRGIQFCRYVVSVTLSSGCSRYSVVPVFGCAGILLEPRFIVRTRYVKKRPREALDDLAAGALGLISEATHQAASANSIWL